jgi:hypothetical protein
VLFGMTVTAVEHRALWVEVVTRKGGEDAGSA